MTEEHNITPDERCVIAVLIQPRKLVAMASFLALRTLLPVLQLMPSTSFYHIYLLKASGFPRPKLSL